MKKNITSLEAEKAFWADPNNYKHFSRAYWEKELKRDGLDFSFFENKIVCEIGCGPFGMIHYADAKQKICVDPLILYYKEIALLPPEKIKDMNLITSYGEDLGQTEIQSDSVDIAICYNVLDHVKDPNKVLLEAKRILKKNGIMYLNCHVVGRFLSPFRKILKFFDSPHPHHFSKMDLRTLVIKNGFAILKEKLYPMTPSLNSLKAVVGRLTMFHYSALASKRKD